MSAKQHTEIVEAARRGEWRGMEAARGGERHGSGAAWGVERHGSSAAREGGRRGSGAAREVGRRRSSAAWGVERRGSSAARGVGAFFNMRERASQVSFVCIKISATSCASISLVSIFTVRSAAYPASLSRLRCITSGVRFPASISA